MALVTLRPKNQMTLPGHELECIWRRQWLYAGHVSSLAAHRSYLTVDIETQSIRRP